MNNEFDIMSELGAITGEIIGLEALANGYELNENGSIRDGISMPALNDDDIITTILSASLGTEAVIRRSFAGKLLHNLNIFFSVNSDSRNSKRAADLSLIDTQGLSQGPSTLKFNKQCINLYVNALGFTSMDRSDLEGLEGLRKEFHDMMKNPDSHLATAFKTYIGRILIGLPMLLVSVPLTIAWCIVTDFVIYYYLIMCIIASFEQAQTLAGTKDDFTRLICGIVASVYKHGSGKTVKFNPNGTIPVAELNRMESEIRDATYRMQDAFNLNSRGNLVEYNDKLEMLNMLKDKRVMIQTRYHYDSDLSRKMGSFYNAYAKNSAKLKSVNQSYSEYSLYLTALSNVMSAIIDNGIACDKSLSIIVNGLYRM